MNNLPATVQLSTLSQEIGALTAKLAPAEPSSIAAYLLSMRKAGMALPQGMKPDDLETVYGYALSEVPACGLKRAVEKIIKGEYDIERAFIPRPPELAAMARAEARTVRDDLTRLRMKENTLKDLQREPDESAEERQRQIIRIKAMHEQYKRDTAEFKASGSDVIHEPMSDEKAEYWRAIEALKDAKAVDAEHLAFRRRVAMEMPEPVKQEDAA